MGDAKRIEVKPISSSDARKIVRAVHYSGKVVQNSQVHFGVFLDGKCGGAMQYGPSLDQRKMLGLVKGTKMGEFIELNRMAFADWLPRNSESRAISVSLRLLRKTYPHLKWVVSFADGTQCGDGTIYRASGFILTQVKPNSSIRVDPKTGELLQRMTAVTSGRGHLFSKMKPLPGFMMRYIYFLHPKERENLTVPVLPFSKLDEMGARMYKGKPRALEANRDVAADQADEGGSTPTPALQPEGDPR